MEHLPESAGYCTVVGSNFTVPQCRPMSGWIEGSVNGGSWQRGANPVIQMTTSDTLTVRVRGRTYNARHRPDTRAYRTITRA